MTHTPGPWFVYDDSNDGKTGRIEIAARGKTVARIYNSVPAEDLPNARLIAAAPALLEALEDVCTQFLGRGVTVDPEHPDHVALKKAEAAIKAAKGEA